MTFIISICLVIITGLTLLIYFRRMTLPFVYIYRASKWKLGTIRTSDPLKIDAGRITPIEWETANVFPKSVFMADPFLVRTNDRFYLFYEYSPSTINNPGADIWAMYSDDFETWYCLGAVLKEQFHLSYPNVFKYKDRWYMLPETNGAKQLRLYSADVFPRKWRLHSVLLDNIIAADPVFFSNEGLNYLLFQDNSDFSLRLYLSPDIDNGWTEHPASPIRTAHMDTRPGGTIGYIGEKLIYFVQDQSEGYGTGLIAYQILNITSVSFSDKKLDGNPVLWKNGTNWMSKGMHHLSWVEWAGEYFCAVDGRQLSNPKYKFNIKNLPRIRL